jgi:hypothetical protein
MESSFPSWERSSIVMLHRSRKIRTAVCMTASLMAIMGISSCAVSYTEKEVRSCYPQYSLSHPKLGTFAVQQSAPGAAIHWGINALPHYKIGFQFRLKVLIDGRNIDGKNQNYEPHGKVRAYTAERNREKTFELAGTITHGQDVLKFDVKCIIE